MPIIFQSRNGEQTMKKYLVAGIVALALSLTGFGTALAGEGPGGGKLKTPFIYTGDVESLGGGGAGLVLLVDGEEVTIYGLGPTSYWESLGVSKPQEGETITVIGYYHETIDKNIAEIIIFDDGSEIELRDDETGKPLWRRNPPKLGHKKK